MDNMHKIHSDTPGCYGDMLNTCVVNVSKDCRVYPKIATAYPKIVPQALR